MFEVVMPYMGAAVDEAVVTEWRKAVGDPVAVGDVLCEVSTDKVDTEVESPEDGVLASIAAAPGDTVLIGQSLATLAPVGTEVAASPPPGADDAPSQDATPTAPPSEAPAAPPSEAPREVEPAPVAAPQAVAAAALAASTSAVEPGAFRPADAAAAVVSRARRDGEPLASPVARRVAEQGGIDLRRVEGTGRNGRIGKADVLRALENGMAPAPAEPRADAPAAPRAATAPTAVPAGNEIPRGYEDVPHDVIAHSRMRRAVAEHMVRSRQVSAHVTTASEVDLSRAEAARADVNGQRVAAGERKLSLLPFIARATTRALAEFPNLNATYLPDAMVCWRDVNLGIAVDAPQGLLVPVIRAAQRLTVDALGVVVAQTAERVRTGDATPDDLSAGTFTITNVGPMGALWVSPTINQPQVAILGVPSAIKRPVVVAGPDGADVIAIRPTIQLSLTFDHRAADGAEATRCLARIKQFLEEWTPDAYR